MIPYFLLLGYLSIFLIFSKNVKSDLFFYLSFFTLTLFSGLRFDVGVDFMSYHQMFEDFKNGNALFLVEPANMMIINIINMLSIDYQVIFFIYSVIIMSGVFYFIKKLSPFKELSILLFVTVGIFYFSTFNGIRQWAAISIGLIAIVKLIEKKHIQFLENLPLFLKFENITIVHGGLQNHMNLDNLSKKAISFKDDIEKLGRINHQLIDRYSYTHRKLNIVHDHRKFLFSSWPCPTLRDKQWECIAHTSTRRRFCAPEIYFFIFSINPSSS